MLPERKVALGFAFVILFAGLMMALQYAGEGYLADNPPDTLTQAYKTGIKAEYYKSDFSYGPNSWRPFKDPLMINAPGGSPGDEWYMMFIKANATPYGGNPYLYRRGAVLVNYTFQNLAGTAAFHVIGFEGENARCRTNRQEGYGASGYFVTGDSDPGSFMPHTKVLISPNNNLIVPAGADHNPENSELFSYYLYFNPLSGGIDSVHITSDTGIVKGEIIETENLSGDFYITHTGGSKLEEILILLCVNESQPDDFLIKIDTSFVPEAA